MSRAFAPRNRRKLQVSVFPVRRRIRRKGIRSDRIERLGLSLARDGDTRTFLRRCGNGRWTQTTIHSRASHTISISGPTHFPFLESRAAHFPDVPPAPAVKCQYGTYPRTKASLVRQQPHIELPPPLLRPSLPRATPPGARGLLNHYGK